MTTYVMVCTSMKPIWINKVRKREVKYSHRGNPDDEEHRQTKPVKPMAVTAHKNRKYARINTVFTYRKKRGNGYVKMLAGEMCRNLIGQGIVPMLCADAYNPSVNSTYIKIGFGKIGELTEFQFE